MRKYMIYVSVSSCKNLRRKYLHLLANEQCWKILKRVEKEFDPSRLETEIPRVFVISDGNPDSCNSIAISLQINDKDQRWLLYHCEDIAACVLSLTHDGFCVTARIDERDGGVDTIWEFDSNTPTIIVPRDIIKCIGFTFEEEYFDE